MTLLNGLLVPVADAVLAPLAGVPVPASVLGLALVTALVVLGVMRLTSNQQQVADAKRLIHADLLEMRLYNDDVRALLRAQAGILRHNARYMWLSLVPLVVSGLPLTLAIAQLQSYYGYEGLPLFTPAVVTADVAGAATGEPLALEGDGFTVDVGPLVFPTLGQAIWRIVPTTSGNHVLTIRAGGTSVEKTWSAGTGVARRSPQREGPGLIAQLLYPSEPPLTGGAITAVRLSYPERHVRVAGWDVHWLIVFVVASFVFVLALRKPLGVVI